MKRKNLGLLVGLLVVLGAGAGLVVWQGGSAAGLATGHSAQADRLWTRLLDLREPYLDDWLGAFDKKRPAPMDVLEAWNEVALQVASERSSRRAADFNFRMLELKKLEAPLIPTLDGADPQMSSMQLVRSRAAAR